MSYTKEHIMTSKEIAECAYPEEEEERKAREEIVTYPKDYYSSLYERLYAEAIAGETEGMAQEINKLNSRLMEASDKAEEIRSLAHDAMHAMWHQDVMKRHKMSQKDFGIPLRRSICSTCSGRGGKKTMGKDEYANPCVGIEEWCDNCCGIGWMLKLVKITEDNV